jgi:lysophospholipase L1-like esterase
MRLSFFLTAALVASAPPVYAQCAPAPALAASREPRPFENEIREFIASDSANRPGPGGVLFIGGSSIRLWPDLAADFPRVKVLQRGFGGGELRDVIFYAPQIVLPYCPRRIVVYAGENDVFAGRSPEEVLQDYKNFVTLVHRGLPDTRIAFVAIKATRSRWNLAEQMRKTNELVRAYSATDPELAYIDTYTPLLRADGTPRDELYATDSLHLSTKGYALWRQLLTPFVYGRQPRIIQPLFNER